MGNYDAIVDLSGAPCHGHAVGAEAEYADLDDSMDAIYSHDSRQTRVLARPGQRSDRRGMPDST